MIKIIFFGTSGFAVPALEALVEAGYDIVAVVTTPDKLSGRRQEPASSPIKIAAEKYRLRVLQLSKLKEGDASYEALRHYGSEAEIGVVASYGKIIPPEILSLPKHGLLNIHPSLLPAYRGPSPVQTAILNGDHRAGVTIIKVDAETDHGPIIAQEEVGVKNQGLYPELHDRLARIGAELLIKVLPDYLDGKVVLMRQDHAKATFTRRFKTEDGEIGPGDMLELAYNKVRALNPEPGTYVVLKSGNKKLRLKVLEASLAGGLAGVPPASPPVVHASPGALFTINNQLALQLQNGYIILKTVQPEGKRPMTGLDFARGHQDLLQRG